MIKCLCKEIKWGEWYRQCEIALGYYWLSDYTQKEDHLLPDCGWSWVTETTESETMNAGGLYSMYSFASIKLELDVRVRVSPQIYFSDKMDG